MATITGPVFRTTMNFTLGGSEIAMFGLHGRWGLNSVLLADVQALADKYRNQWNSAMSDAKSGFCSSVKADFVRVAQLDTTPGPQFLKETAFVAEAGFTGANAWAGTNSTSLPWETSMCINLAAYAPNAHVLRAGRRRGRFYLPPMSPDSIGGTEGQYTSPLMNVVLDGVQEWLEAMNDVLSGSQFRHVVISRGGTKDPIDAPGMFDVEHIFSDSIVDSQRRRRNKEVPALRVVRTLDA